MAYRQVTLRNATSGYTIVVAPAAFTGSVSCVSGEIYVRLKHVPDANAVNGANAAVTNPTVGLADPNFLDGWNHLAAGNSTEFGGERTADTTYIDTVSQIDIYCVSASEVAVTAH